VVRSGWVNKGSGITELKRGAGGKPTQKDDKQPEPPEFDHTLHCFYLP
jgi:hypothetical protein